MWRDYRAYTVSLCIVSTRMIRERLGMTLPRIVTLGVHGWDVKTIAFFCVGRAPEACHRSLAAAKFAALGAEMEHLCSL